jgi:hypothetical protein
VSLPNLHTREVSTQQSGLGGVGGVWGNKSSVPGEPVHLGGLIGCSQVGPALILECRFLAPTLTGLWAPLSLSFPHH